MILYVIMLSKYDGEQGYGYYLRLVVVPDLPAKDDRTGPKILWEA